MLEYNCEDNPMLDGLVRHLRCEITIPPCLSGFFEKKESHVVVADEKRRYKRWNFRNFGGMECRQSLKGLKRMSSWHRIYIKDISIEGLAFLHSEQLFPLEQMRIILPKKTIEQIFISRNNNIVEVMRCHKWGEQCYEIGAQFVDEFRD